MKKIDSVLALELDKINPSKEEFKVLVEESKNLIRELELSIKKNKIKAQVFIGGSFAKNTLIRKNKYDIDIFVRFNSSLKEEEISKFISKVVPSKAQRVHGSRDYFVLKSENKLVNLEFEIIPVISIKKTEQARNITDLSYFHVKYINDKIKKRPQLAKEIMLTKAFIHYQDCYGAESYINGFSGYAVELLIIAYGSFINFLRALVKSGENKIILDSEKQYKNKNDIMMNINEAKLQSPIILVDPTFKERNALAALSRETFLKLKESAGKFLKNPSLDFFVKEDREKIFMNKNKEVIKIEVTTDKQAGDIAGTKLRKFFRFFINESLRYLDIKASDFNYDEKANTGKILLSAKPKKEILFNGPPVEMIEQLKKFKKEHKKIETKNGKTFAFEKGYLTFEEFLSYFQNKNSDVIGSMNISGLRVIS
jgi:tRNA nucleotidyltransferase (CCA-adding enzyme)